MLAEHQKTLWRQPGRNFVSFILVLVTNESWKTVETVDEEIATVSKHTVDELVASVAVDTGTHTGGIFVSCDKETKKKISISSVEIIQTGL